MRPTDLLSCGSEYNHERKLSHIGHQASQELSEMLRTLHYHHKPAKMTTELAHTDIFATLQALIKELYTRAGIPPRGHPEAQALL